MGMGRIGAILTLGGRLLSGSEGDGRFFRVCLYVCIARFVWFVRVQLYAVYGESFFVHVVR